MISIIVCSANDKLFEQFSMSVENSIGVPFEIVRITNKQNEFGICHAYNEGIRRSQYDILCLVHEDVIFYTSEWGRHLLDVFSSHEIGLVGIFGACYLSLYPNAWVDPSECQGQVIEGFKEDKPIRRAVRFPGHPLTEVVAIDGVFMATRKSVIKDYLFPEDLLKGFHGYDLDISMHIRRNYKLVVTSDLLLLHLSKGNYGDDYYNALRLMYKKWKSFLPAYTSAYSKQEVKKLTLKSLNQFGNNSPASNFKINNLLKAGRYAMEKQIFLPWLYRKILKMKDKLNPETFLPMDHAEIDHGFSKTRDLLTDYFNQFPKQRSIYSRELDFINNLPGQIPIEEKLLHTIIPYPFILDYNYQQVEVFFDSDCAMYYVFLGKHRLYYHRGFQNEEDVRKSFTYISVEQHPDSPHRYLDNEFRINSQDVVADIGAAEGNFSLMVVDIVKELIIVEADSRWIEALEKTFAPWKNKVTIVNKWIGGDNDDKNITIDKLPSVSPITAIKMDVEGAELKVLHKSQHFIRKNNIRMAITLYHRHSDEADIEHLLNKNLYRTSFSKGYILFIYDEVRPPYFRKGLIKASDSFTPH